MPERVIARFRPDRRTYVRDHIFLAVVGAIGVMVVLALIGNAHVWVGLVAAPAAIAVRGIYLAPEELDAMWELTDVAVNGPGDRRVPLDQIARVRKLGSAAQIVTRSGDKHLMKYMSDPAGIARQIDAERGV